MIRVRAPSRLHFGLFNPWPADPADPSPPRRFGGVGLMVEAPGVVVAVEPADDWRADGPLAERALAFAQRFLAAEPRLDLGPHRLRVERCAPEHAGLGTGTQLGLAVGRALAAAAGRPDLGAAELARRVGRGRRSAVGTYGFDRGGLVVDAGQRPGESLGGLAVHAPFPADWRIVLIQPSAGPGLHGPAEQRAFEQAADAGRQARHVEALGRLMLFGLLPALAQHDLAAFGEALYEFNRRAGEPFAASQGAAYAGPAAAAVAWLRRFGIAGAGQSSWGPTVFGVLSGPSPALTAAIRERLAPAQHIMVTAASLGARIERAGDETTPG